MKIIKMYGRQILDSRGHPTIECIIELGSNMQVNASVPSGTSVGRYEAQELRDGGKEHFAGKGVLKAIANLGQKIAPMFVGQTPDIIAMDEAIINSDGTVDKSHFGANTMLAASIAIIRAQAVVQKVELFQLINTLWNFEPPVLPICMFNFIHGGLHAQTGLAFQEFMVMPQDGDFNEQLETADRIYEELKKILRKNKYATTVGDEGGFAPVFNQQGIAKEQQAINLLLAAIAAADAKNVAIALDVAASHFYDVQQKKYRLYDQSLDALELIQIYENLCKQYPIQSIEDALDQDDWKGWRNLTEKIGKKIQLVGDDLFVTNQQRITQGIMQHVANAVLIKPNQIGTVSETIDAIKLCKKHGYKTIVSHRSGETNDTFIADLVVGTAAGQLKAGAPVRGERVAKYNRLLEIQKIVKNTKY